MSRTRAPEVAALLKRSSFAVAVTGAGISVPSGLPAFRTQDGVWQAVPMEEGTLTAFQADPRRLYSWFGPMAKHILSAQPNPAHFALAELEQNGLLRGVITQNIDNLHQAAGSRNVVELHGHLRTATCSNCGALADLRPTFRAWTDDTPIPACGRCGQPIKPDIILFEEYLPQPAVEAAYRLADRSDLMLVVGTSLEVMTATAYVSCAHANGARLIFINPGPTALDEWADVRWAEDAATALPAVLAAL